MKKIFSLLLLCTAGLKAVFAADLAVLVASVSPLTLYQWSLEKETIVPEYREDYSLLALPIIVADSDLETMDLLSKNPVKLFPALFEAALIYSDLEDFSPVLCSGEITVTPKIEYGKAGAVIGYDDFDLTYSANDWTSRGRIDGTIDIDLIYKTEHLAELSIISDTTLEKGEMRLLVDFDEDAANNYLEEFGEDLDSLMMYAFAFAYPHLDEISAELGIDLSSIVNYEDAVSILEDMEIMDVLNAAAFFMFANEYYYLSGPEAFSMVLDLTLIMDGEEIDLGRLLKNSIKMVNFMDSF